MSFYDTANLPNSETTVETSDYHSTLLYGNTSIEFPKRPVSYTGNSVTYTAEDLLNGCINRYQVDDSSPCVDSFGSAADIIAALQRRITTLSGIHNPIANGTSFTCYINNLNTNYDDTDFGISYYSTFDYSVRIGGQTTQITGGASAEVTIVVQDQARFGAGHKDQIFVCISRCAAGISID
jgi:hypothetical protein